MSWWWPRSQEIGERARLYRTLHCHHQNDSSIEMGSDANYFNASLIVRGKITRQCPQTATLEDLKTMESRSRIEPRSFCLQVLSLTARPNLLTETEPFLVLSRCKIAHTFMKWHKVQDDLSFLYFLFTNFYFLGVLNLTTLLRNVLFTEFCPHFVFMPMCVRA